MELDCPGPGHRHWGASVNPKTILDTVVLARIARVAQMCHTWPQSLRRRKAAALALLARLLFCQAALASDVAYFEADSTFHSR